MDDIVKLYRAVSRAELADIQQKGGFEPGPPSYQGKWFAEALGDAAAWGQRLYGSAKNFHIAEMELPLAVADLLFRVDNLDRIGPARFADVDQLQLINSANLGIVEVAISPGGP